MISEVYQTFEVMSVLTFDNNSFGRLYSITLRLSNMPTLAYFQVGVHGIKIEFGYGRSTKTATFLPDVAKEQGLETSWGQIMLFSYPINFLQSLSNEWIL